MIVDDLHFSKAALFGSPDNKAWITSLYLSAMERKGEPGMDAVRIRLWKLYCAVIEMNQQTQESLVQYQNAKDLEYMKEQTSNLERELAECLEGDENGK